MGKRKSGLEELIGGICVLAVCGVLVVVFHGPPWIVFPALFLGGFPLIKGGQRMVRERQEYRLEDQRNREERDGMVERAILKSANRNRGVVTPTLVSLEANITLEKADATLQNMAARGYAEMRIRENGTIEYHFPDFAS